MFRLNLTLFGSAVLNERIFIFELNFKNLMLYQSYLLSNIDIHIDIHLELVFIQASEISLKCLISHSPTLRIPVVTVAVR